MSGKYHLGQHFRRRDGDLDHDLCRFCFDVCSDEGARLSCKICSASFCCEECMTSSISAGHETVCSSTLRPEFDAHALSIPEAGQIHHLLRERSGSVDSIAGMVLRDQEGRCICVNLSHVFPHRFQAYAHCFHAVSSHSKSNLIKKCTFVSVRGRQVTICNLQKKEEEVVLTLEVRKIGERGGIGDYLHSRSNLFRYEEVCSLAVSHEPGRVYNGIEEDESILHKKGDILRRQDGSTYVLKMEKSASIPGSYKTANPKMRLIYTPPAISFPHESINFLTKKYGEVVDMSSKLEGWTGDEKDAWEADILLRTLSYHTMLFLQRSHRNEAGFCFLQRFTEMELDPERFGFVQMQKKMIVYKGKVWSV